MNKYQTLDNLTEKVYVVDDTNTEVEIDYELASFFNELMKRRRFDSIEDGLQGGGVIYSDRAGLKISERDGKAGHAHAQENASQYINGKKEFSSEEALGMIGSRKDDPNSWINIPKNGFTVRVVANKDLLIFIFNTYSYALTSFQLNVVHKLFDYIKYSYQNKSIKYPYVNFVTPRKKFVFNEYKDINEQLIELENVITKAEEEIKEKTRSH